MLTLQDLQEYEGMYYVGHLIEMDGDGWVDEGTALAVLSSINS